ncbi:potassium channel family protein [Actinophytocola sp.]|uniref:potassium channel family protein n=1 Tax=Actinophytocola sp. TaxID=1872138 RepID=UPI002D7E6AE3|nr:ion channel [Actinophytocola sp.]HET9142713.1 ion channel [Actinophytocola sp.]
MSPNAAHPASPADDGDEPRLSAWTRRTDWPLTGLAVIFLAVYAWQVLDTTAAPARHTALETTMWVIWAIFALDYLTRLALARRKGRFVWRHLLDLIAVALPMARQLRALRVLTLLSVLNRRAAVSLRGRLGVYVAAIILLIGTCAALAVLDAERRNPDANITTFTDALWWTLTTITTVGYGDRYPTTTEGRMVAAALMIGGIALLGVTTGIVASWFVEKITGLELSIEDTTQSELRALRAELAALRANLDDPHPRPDAPDQAGEQHPVHASTKYRSHR